MLTVNVHTKNVYVLVTMSQDVVTFPFIVWNFFFFLDKLTPSLSLLGSSFKSNCYLVAFYLGNGLREPNLDPKS